MNSSLANPNVVGHQNVIDRFARWLQQGRLASTYLLAGPDGIGKRKVATWLAKALLCESTERNQLTTCDSCSACQQVDAGSHPDLLVVEKPDDKNRLPIELLIGSREQRMRAGLCHDITLKPYRGGRRIAIIDDADFLNVEGANCLLKTLEEPPAFATIFLISSSEHRQLPTIRSRSQTVRFSPLRPDEIESILGQNQDLDSNLPIAQMALASCGSVKLALQLADNDTLDFRSSWLDQLASLDPGDDGFAESISSFVDAAGKDTAMKRDRLRLVAEMAGWFFRNVMVALCEQPIVADDVMARCVQRALERWSRDADAAAQCVARCEEVHEHVTANANQQLVIESLLSDLGRIIRGEILQYD